MSETERANVKVAFHPLRDEEANEPLSGTELTATKTRSAHVLQLAYREKRSGCVRECKAVVCPSVELERLTRSLSVLSELAEWADQTRGLGAKLHDPSPAWATTREGLARVRTPHLGSDLTNEWSGAAAAGGGKCCAWLSSAARTLQNLLPGSV